MFKPILLSLALVNACSANQAPEHADIVFTEFPSTEYVTLKNLFSLDNIRSVSKIHLTDSTILFKNHEGVNDFFYYEYLLSSEELIRQYIKGGRGKGEAFGSFSSGIYGDKLWMFDVSARKIIFTGLGNGVTEEYKVPHFYYNIQLMNGLKAIGNGAPHSTYKIQQIDMATETEDFEFGEYENVPYNTPVDVWKKAYESQLYISPDEEYAVAVCLSSDQIEIVDLKTRTSKLISGPENFKAEFSTYKDDWGKDVVYNTEKSRYAFLNGFVTDKYIYLLYSGKNTKADKSFYGEYIYVFDWNGNPVKKLELDKSVLCIAVSQDDKVLYTFDETSQYALYGNLD
ncbi:MAG TPA: BF3164 family lipoprotein [Sphingobacteriaceae bacterium]|nr:BF3164 family lipoprotein [Sphingobacteriaceae bacterium]